MQDDNVVPMTKHAPPEWGTEDPSYSPAKFYTKGTDGRGNSHEVRVRMPPTVVGQIQALIEQKGVPEYRTASDVVRDAVIHRLKWLEEHMLADDPDLARRVKGIVASAELQRLRDEIDASKEQVDQARSILNEAETVGNQGMLRRAIQHCWDIADGLDEPWRSKVEEAINDVRRRT